jgi:nitroreductase
MDEERPDSGPDSSIWLAALASRFSVGPKHLAEPGPTAEELAQAAALALRAPDHGGLRPFRFVHIAASQRAALGELFATGARERGLAGADVERARERAFNGPALLALVGCWQPGHPEVPLREQLLCAGAGLMNLLNALHLMGYGAKTLSGASVDDPAVCRAFCGESEQLLCWVVCGRPKRAAHPRYPAAPVAPLSDWGGPEGH